MGCGLGLSGVFGVFGVFGVNPPRRMATPVAIPPTPHISTGKHCPLACLGSPTSRLTKPTLWDFLFFFCFHLRDFLFPFAFFLLPPAPAELQSDATWPTVLFDLWKI